ncbi:MAG: DUF4167 domain-containing protein [Pseudomonadota bacterium]
MAQYSKRGRNNNRRRQGGNNNPNRSMDSQGPEVKIRGTATQIYDKYQALARDAASSGDRIRAESLMQHAEHYYRLMKSMQPEKPAEPRRDQSEEPQATADEQQASVDTSADTKPDEQAAVVETASEGSTEEAVTEANADDAAAATDENQEEQRPRRRRRRRRTGDDAETADANGESSPPESAAELEEAGAK